MRSRSDWVAVAVLLASCLSAQCPLAWTSGGPQPDLTGEPYCSTLWDPDGAGPVPQRFVIGGRLLTAGDAVNQRVVAWDGTQWEALGPGPGTSGAVRALASWNGTLVAAGDPDFTGLALVSRWDGSSWQPLGPPSIPMRALIAWNGLLVAAGFQQVGSTFTPLVRTWNGTAWSTLPSPPTVWAPLTLATFQGMLCVGGYVPIPSPTVGVIERWNGSAWSASVTANGAVTSLVVKPTTVFGGNETLFAGGSFTNIAGTPVSYVAATSGSSLSTWSALSGGTPGPTTSLHVRGYGAGLSSFVLTAGMGDTVAGVRQLNAPFGGTASWSTIGTFRPTSLGFYAGAYHATGLSSVGACLRHNGTQFLPVHGPGVDDDVRAATRLGNDIAVGGRFSTIAGVAASAIARWNGSTFHPIGGGMTGPVGGGMGVDALLTLGNGDIVAGGQFQFAGPMPANCIARWNGTAWSTFGAGMDQQVLALAELPNGNLVAGGSFTQADGLPCMRIASWDGSHWQSFGAGANGSVQALAVRPDGVLFAAGSFSSIDGVACSRIAQWNGTSWAPLGTGCNDTVFDLAVRPNGDLVAVGAFTTAGGVAADRCARWDGSVWLAMGTSSVDPADPHAVLALPNGDVVVSHGFHTAGNVPDEGLARWNGSVWSAVGTIKRDATDPDAVAVRCLAQRADGELVVGGDFRFANGVVSRNLAAVRSTCAPTVSSYGTGCNSGAGLLTITADTLPWIGAPFRTTTTGVAPGLLCLATIGLTQLSIPLPLLLGEGQPGCSLLASLDILLVAANGPGNTASTSFVFANDAALIGVPFFQQALPLEFDALGGLAAVRASDALAATIGTM